MGLGDGPLVTRGWRLLDVLWPRSHGSHTHQLTNAEVICTKFEQGWGHHHSALKGIGPHEVIPTAKKKPLTPRIAREVGISVLHLCRYWSIVCPPVDEPTWVNKPAPPVKPWGSWTKDMDRSETQKGFIGSGKAIRGGLSMSKYIWNCETPQLSLKSGCMLAVRALSPVKFPAAFPHILFLKEQRMWREQPVGVSFLYSLSVKGMRLKLEGGTSSWNS